MDLDDFNVEQIRAHGSLSVADRIDDAATSRYPATNLYRLEDEGVISEGAAKQLVSEFPDGWFCQMLETEALLKDTDRQLQETRDKLRAAELMVAMRRVA